MEHTPALAARQIKRLTALVALLCVAAPGVGQQESQPYFSLSANQTFASGAAASINLSAVNVDALEFRVYRINDAVKFVEQLESPNHFGEQTAAQRRPLTWIERVRSWKRGLKAEIRRNLRAQFTEPPHEHFDVLSTPSSSTLRTQGKEIRYAQAPVLNSQQLVLTFVHPITTKDRWDSEAIDIGVREKGVYLVEAVRGNLHAHTILMVSDLVLTTKTGRGRIVTYVSDRETGEPIEGAEVWMLRPKVGEDVSGGVGGVAARHFKCCASR
jgi:alpha-2-macroglobulin